MNFKKLSVLMPMYNEELAVASNILETDDYFKKLGISYEIIVMDDGSKDMTYDKALGLNKEHIKVHKLEKNEGKGEALREAFNKCGGDLVMFLDGDLDIHPKQFEVLFEAMKKGNEQYLLKGLIEMDDSYFGQRAVSGKVGRGSGYKRIVLAAVEVPDNKKPRFAALKTLQDLSAQEIESCLKKLVDDHQIFKTDGYSSYKILPGIGHFHFPKILKEKSIIKEHLPWVHILIGNVKNALRATFHGVSAKHLQRYLDEFTYRFNRRYSESKIFDQLLTACIYSKTITFAELRE